jgi:hypothetical protein
MPAVLGGNGVGRGLWCGRRTSSNGARGNRGTRGNGTTLGNGATLGSAVGIVDVGVWGSEDLLGMMT